LARNELVFTKGNRANGTCEWVEDHELYKGWLAAAGDNQSRLLSIVGGPGTGKTMLSIFLTHRLEDFCAKSQSIFLYFICRHDDKDRNNATGALRSLIWQLLAKQDIEFSKSKMANVAGNRESRSLQAAVSTSFGLWILFADLLSQVQSSTRPLVLLDGLDECDAESVRFLLDHIRNSPELNVGFLIVSRDSPYLSGIPQIRMDRDNQRSEVEKFICQGVNHLATLGEFESEFLRHVEETLLEKSEGTFLWAGFAVQALHEPASPTQALTASQITKTLSKLPASLETLYTRVWRDIASSDDSIQLLRWVTTAVRALTVRELGFLMGYSSTQHISVEQAVLDVIASCGPLLVVGDRGVAFVHLSARQYLTKPAGQSMTPGALRLVGEDHINMAQRCLEILERVFARTEYSQESWNTSFDEFPILEYATAYGFVHAARVFSPPDSLFDLNRPILQQDSLIRRRWITAYNASIAPDSDQIQEESLLVLAAYFDLAALGTLALQSQHFAQTAGRKVTRLFRRLQRSPDPQENMLSAALLVACERGSRSMVEMLVKAGADPDGALNSGGFSALSSAIFRAQNEVVDLLIEHKLGINPSSPATILTPLGVAAALGNKPLMARLIDAGADVNSEVGSSPFLLAALGNHEDAVKLLIRSGADINPSQGALGLLVGKGEEEGARLLLRYGANPNMIVEFPDCGNATILSLAVLNSQLSFLEHLLDRGADVNATGGKMKETALHHAAYENSAPILHLLIERGASLDIPTQTGATALHYASVAGCDAAVRTLLDKGAAVDYTCHSQFTALHQASGRGHSTVVVSLLRYGADINAKGLMGFTALHLATSKGHIATMEVLLGNGARLNEVDNNGDTALHLAIMNGVDEATRWLLDKGADISTRNKAGLCPIHLAALCHGDMAMKLILERGCDVNVTDGGGLTALMLAVSKDFGSRARLLLEHGADPNMKLGSVSTALDMVDANNPGLSALLLQHGARRSKGLWPFLRSLG
jgi:ankyrin repeat protein